mmetsp:Transcript_57329/g.150972  ORF Transcript_57329/g.150972 Transcript_57329/m.150972 type:complete len:390 (+) Transcript_57329:80-1249(+)
MQTESALIEGKAKKVKEYLEKDVVPVLTQALTKLCIEEPDDPFTWLAKYLIENHPTKAAKVQWTQVLVMRLKEGDFFGEIALLSGKPRQATVKASGKVSVLVIGRDAFTRLCGNLTTILQRNMTNYSSVELPPEEAHPAQAAAAAASVEEEEDDHSSAPAPAPAPSMPKMGRRRQNVFVEAVEVDADWVAPSYPHTEAEVQRLHEYVSKTILLSHLDQQAKETVIGAFQCKNYTLGQDIITQGADADFYYILDSGHADVYKSTGGAPAVKVFEYGPGGAFGELALLHGEPRLATVRATEPCMCWALDRTTFRKIMMSTGRQDMQERTQFLARVQLLQELQHFERFRIAEAMTVRSYEDGEVIVEEGDPGHEFFIIQRGNCSCFKRTLRL